MLNNLLSNYVALMYCIDCQRNDMILQTVDGKLFHLVGYHQSFNSKGTVKVEECHGPFAHSEPPTVEELDFINIENLYQFMNEEDGLLTFRGWYGYTFDAWLSSLEKLHNTDKYFPSVEEILWDNIHHGDVDLFKQ